MSYQKLMNVTDVCNLEFEHYFKILNEVLIKHAP